MLISFAAVCEQHPVVCKEAFTTSTSVPSVDVGLQVFFPFFLKALFPFEVPSPFLFLAFFEPYVDK